MIIAEDGTKFYTRKDIMKIFKLGDVKSLALFNNPEFPAQKFGRAWIVEVNAFNDFVKTRHVYDKIVY